MNRMTRSLAYMLVTAPLVVSAPAIAGLFSGTPLEGLEEAVKDGVDATHNVLKNGIDETRKVLEKGIKEVGNGLEDLGEEGGKLLTKVVKEMGNAGEDLRILIAEGKCGGDICDALKATVGYVKGTFEGYGKAVADAAERISEGKPLDAFWHLSVASIDVQQEAAAQAAMESSVLRAVGQVAAGVYGGPAGAAAYAAWLTYHQTGGDLELAIKAGAIAGATAYAMTAISTEVPLLDVVKGVQADEFLQRAVMTGAVSGLAVGLSGGSQADIEQAFTKGAITSVIRDSYSQLTESDLEANLKPSTGAAYCLGADPNATANGARLSCLPEPDAYVPAEGTAVRINPDGTIDPTSIKYVDGKPEIDFFKLQYERPHVGTWSEVPKDGGILGSGVGPGETTPFMTGVSRIPGMNGMAVAHDIFDATTNPDVNVVIDYAYTVGTIAPFVVMTYEGAGFGVQEMIRDVTVDSNRPDGEPTVAHRQAEAPVPQSAAGTPQAIEAAATAAVLADSTPYELRHLHCEKGQAPRKTFLMEMLLRDDDPDDYERICRIDQHIRGDQWAHLWHAHYQESFCIQKMNAIMKRYLNRGYTCYSSLGVRFDPPAPGLASR